jgi:Tfp pilus assembly protein PilF
MSCSQIIRSCITAASILVVSTSGGCRTSSADLKRETSEALIRQAAASFAAGDFRKNADLLGQAADTDPDNPKVWWKLCEAYQLTDELDLAVKACKRELDLHPSSSSHNGLGLVYLTRKDYPQAAAEFEKAAADTSISQIHSNYVWALLESKQYERAIAAAERLVEVSKADSPELKTTQSAYHYLAIAYMKTGNAEKAQEAVADGYDAGCSMEVGDKPEDALVRCKDGSTVKESVRLPSH